jgi:hypothetical protein
MASNGKRRSGSGKFPPNPTQWDAERNGLSFRSRFGVRLDEPLRPFTRVLPKVAVVGTRLELLEYGVEEQQLKKLFGVGRKQWSGMTIPCDDEFIVVMNYTHAKTRQHATLMEEFFHILLGHKPSRVYLCPDSGVIRREYDRTMENEAYYSAAASLVPYAAMKEMVERGATSRDIAGHFEVSGELVIFRLKTCKLYRRAS